jgi:hypothetical protein
MGVVANLDRRLSLMAEMTRPNRSPRQCYSGSASAHRPLGPSTLPNRVAAIPCAGIEQKPTARAGVTASERAGFDPARDERGEWRRG